VLAATNSIILHGLWENIRTSWVETDNL
jgi:hypothetical protein